MTKLTGRWNPTSSRADVRLHALAAAVWERVERDRREFDFPAVAAALGIVPAERDMVAAEVYKVALRKAWANGAIDAGERRSLDFLAGRLGMDADYRGRLESAACVTVFRSALTAALADGVISAAERDALAAVAAGIGATTRTVVQRAFAAEGTSFVRELFDRLASDGSFDAADWRRLVASAAALGLTEDEVRDAIAGQAAVVVEEALAHAKADGVVTPAERAGLRWLAKTFDLPPSVAERLQAGEGPH